MSDIMRTKLDAIDEMQVGTNPPPVDSFVERNIPLVYGGYIANPSSR